MYTFNYNYNLEPNDNFGVKLLLSETDFPGIKKDFLVDKGSCEMTFVNKKLISMNKI